MYARVSPRLLRKNVVCPQTTRYLTTSIHIPPTRCPRSFQPTKPTPIQRRHASFPVASKKLFKENPFSVSLATFMYLFPTLPSPPPLTNPQHTLQRGRFSLHQLHLQQLYPRRLREIPRARRRQTPARPLLHEPRPAAQECAQVLPTSAFCR